MSALPPPQDARVRAAWAKYDQNTGDVYPLYAHLQDTAAVAELLFDRWFSHSQKQILSEAFGTEDVAKQVSIWLGAAHDVGKATSAFAMKAPSYQAHMSAVGFAFPEPAPPPNEQRAYPHGLAGQRAVASYLKQKPYQGRSRAIARLSEIVGGHHGVFPENTAPSYPLGDGEAPVWHEVRVDLLRRADLLAGLDDQGWQHLLGLRIPETAQAILTGFLVMCDWIASNREFFPYGADVPPEASAVRASAALAELEFGDHWHPEASEDATDYFSHRFGIETPRPVQREALAFVSALEEPSLVLIEAPTGEGKTEIGFSCAEILASRFGLHGFAIFLPTRATTNAMFSRVLNWLRSSDPETPAVSVSLLHAKAEFEEQYESLFHVGSAEHIYGDGNAEEDAAVGNSWFRGRKTKALADFAIGTIDQLLFLTLKAKHLVLRHLGLSGKVIVIDEVHAADEFMRTYLHRALHWLGAYGVPVIALSATLPPAQRESLLLAYQEGARSRIPLEQASDPGPEDTSDVGSRETIAEFVDADSYPLVTAAGASRSAQIAPAHSARRNDYEVETVADEALVDAILEESKTGGCIAVVCNTVNRAQRVFRELSERTGASIQLFHSRFTVESRSRRESDLIAHLGRDGQRPDSLIVVATQVVESSLDVDFDLMFSDIAPIDLLLQRMGRLHRHSRPAGERPASMQRPRIILTGGDNLLGASPDAPDFAGGARAVYGDAALLRTVSALRAHRKLTKSTLISVPDDVPHLIRAAYADDVTAPPEWDDRVRRAELERREKQREQRERSEQFVIDVPSTVGIREWSRLAFSEATEEQRGGAQVRDAELSLEVVLVQQRGGRVYSLPWLGEGLGGELVDLTAEIDSKLARAVATCTVSLPSWTTRGSGLDRVLDDLERNGFEGWQRSPWLRGMLPLIVDENFSTSVGDLRVRYEEELGLLIEKEGVS